MRQTVADPALTDQPLAELKAWLAITGTSEDGALVNCLVAATTLCEQFTGQVPLLTRFCETLPSASGALVTSARPVRRLIAARALGTAERLIPAADYDTLFASDGTLSLRFLVALKEPLVVLEYEAGSSEDWAALEAGLRHGILRHAAHLYRSRDADRSEALPAAIAALWRPYRRLSL